MAVFAAKGVNMLKITDLLIDPRSLGNKFWLVSTSPAVEYKDNRRTDNVTGYRYSVCLPEKGLEKINVKIEGKQLMEAPESGYVEVNFTDLEVFIYWQNGQPNVGARAKGITAVNHKG